jgi:NTE family protein
VALVLAGGGARGPYEVGALAELLPALEQRERPQILLGTSVGAINVAFLAANAAAPMAQIIADGLSLWRSVRFGQVLRPLVSVSEVARLGGYLGEVLGVRGARADSLLDPSPLTATLNDMIAFRQIHQNVEQGHLLAAAVVASSGATNLSVVFHDGGPHPPPDRRRGIEYVSTTLNEAHVRASAAIPLLFPAVAVQTHGARHWYFDGGTRLNTPIKPAIELGAGRVIVVALNSLAPRSLPRHERRPDALDGAGQIIQAVLVDPLVNDVHTLASINQMLADDSAAKVAAHERRTGRRRIPYILVAPQDPGEIGRVAAEVYERHFSSPLDLVRSPNLAGLGRLLSAGSSADHGELLSYLFFAEAFADRLIELGRRDAARWLRETHDEGHWQLGPLPD